MNTVLTVLWCAAAAVQLVLAAAVLAGTAVAEQVTAGRRRLIAAGFAVSGLMVAVGRVGGIPVVLWVGVVGCVACPLLLGVVARDVHPVHHVARGAALGALVIATVVFA